MGDDQLELSIAQAAQRPRGAHMPRQARPICALADFTDLCRLVADTSSRVAQTKFIAGYLRGLGDDPELRLAVRWLTGEALPPRCGVRGLREGALTVRHALLALPGARAERYQELFLSNRNIARSARLLLQELPLRPEPLDLPGLEAFFLTLAQTAAPLDRISLLAARLVSLHPMESETLVRLLGGDPGGSLETGVIEEAIAAAFAAAPAAVRHAHRVSADLAETALLARHARLDQALAPPAPAAHPAGAPEDTTLSLD